MFSITLGQFQKRKTVGTIWQNGYKVKHFRKVYFDVWDLKLEILTCFDTALCHLHGVTLKNISQYSENNLMQCALSHRDAFRPCSRVSSGDDNTIYTPLKQNIHIVRLSYNSGRKLKFFYLNFTFISNQRFWIIKETP